MDLSKIRNYLFLGLVAIVSLLFFGLLKPFGYAIFWAAVIAALCYPIYRALNKRFAHANLSALTTIMLVSVIILLPLFIMAVLLVYEVGDLYGSIQNNQGQVGTFITTVSNALEQNEFARSFGLTREVIINRFATAGQTIARWGVNQLTAFTQNSVVFLIEFVIMLYTLFFFLRDGETILKKLMYLMPFGDKYEVALYKKFTTAASAAIKGTLLVGVIQGSLGGLIFAIAGVPSVLILTLIMIVLAMIPGVGAALLWAPVGILLILIGHVWQGVMVLLFGILIISTIDNLLRPLLVGRQLNLHPLLILFSTLGGLALFGLSGFVIGPVVAALFIAVWGIYEEYYKHDLDRG